MNKNYPIYKTTFIDDFRSLVEEAAQNFPDSIAISYKDKPSDKEVKKVLSPVRVRVWGRVVAGSNPVTPTEKKH